MFALFWVPISPSGDNNVDTLFRVLNADWKFDYVVNIKGAPTINNTKVSEVLSGCGDKDQKCRCEFVGYVNDQTTAVITMYGIGTSWSWTGLDFTCSFDVGFRDRSCSCNLHVDMPYTTWFGLEYSFNHDCPCLTGFTRTPCKWCWGSECSGTDNVTKINP